MLKTWNFRNLVNFGSASVFPPSNLLSKDLSSLLDLLILDVLLTPSSSSLLPGLPIWWSKSLHHFKVTIWKIILMHVYPIGIFVLKLKFHYSKVFLILYSVTVSRNRCICNIRVYIIIGLQYRQIFKQLKSRNVIKGENSFKIASNLQMHSPLCTQKTKAFRFTCHINTNWSGFYL